VPEISSVAMQLAASQNELCSMGLVNTAMAKIWTLCTNSTFIYYCIHVTQATKRKELERVDSYVKNDKE
jgi:hypothetical protein